MSLASWKPCMLAVLLLGLAGQAPLAAETYTMETIYAEGVSVALKLFSPDGNRILTVYSEGMPRIEPVQGDGPVTTLDGGSPRFAAFSPDGQRVVTLALDDTLQVWDADSGKQIASQDTRARQAHSAAFSPDGLQLVLACADGTARVWNIAEGREVAVLQGHTDDVIDAAFSPDGGRIVTASLDKSARVWDVASARELAALPHPNRVTTAAFSADGAKIVTGSADQVVRIFAALGGRPLTELKGHEGGIVDAQFSADGSRVATGSDDDSARIWDAESGAELAALEGHLATVYFVAFNEDASRVFTAAGDATARIWSRLAAAALPAGVEGLWYPDFLAPEPMPEEIARASCLATPTMVHADGVVVQYEGYEPDPPAPNAHLRCGSDLTCQIFAGGPAQGLEPQGSAKIEFNGDKAKICVQDHCTAMARCPETMWTDGQRDSGYAAAWEAAVLGEAK